MLLLQHFTKQCSKCNKIKYFNDFNYHIEGKFKLRPDCKECVAIYKKEYSVKNKEKIALRKKEWGIENRKSRNDYEATWKNNNKDKVAKYSRKYNSSDKWKISSKNSEHKRRDVEKLGSVKNIELQNLQKNTKNCYWCGISLKHTKVHLDHYEPLSKGGSHMLSNLVVSCAKCNRLKSAKDPILFANSLGRLL